MSLAIVQHDNAIHGSSIPGAITLGATPTSGNLLIAFIGCNLTRSSITVGAGWTQFDGVNLYGNALNAAMTCLYRYVLPGDTATLPAFWSAGTTYWSHQVYEISGVSGTWDDDLLSSAPLYGPQATNNLPPLPLFNSGLALTGFSRYNGNANPTISGSWSLDDANNNAGNFGSAGGAHRAISNGDVIDGAWSGGGTATNAVASCLVVLAAARPTANKPVVRHVLSYTPGAATPGVIPCPWIPKQGCLQICYLDWGQATGSDPVIGGDWTEFKNAQLSAKKTILGLYRYAGASETVLKAIATGGSEFNFVTIVELDNVSGTFGADHASSQSGAQATGATFTTVSDTTTHAAQLALLAFGNYNTSTTPSTTGFDGYLTQDADGTDYGGFFVALKYAASNGSSVQGVITPGLTTTPQSYIQDIFYSAAVGETGTAALAFGGVTFAGVGAAKRSGIVGLHFGAVSLVATGSDLTAPIPPTPPPGPSTNRPRVDPLTWNVPIVTKDGGPTQEFQRKWDKQASVNAGVVPQSYIDTQDTAQLTVAKGYTESYGATVLVAAKAYADSKPLLPLTAYTVATLPAAPASGTMAMVTDATTPTYLGALVGGGAVVTPVFYNGTAWLSH